jgi:hypothetical protein
VTLLRWLGRIVALGGVGIGILTWLSLPPRAKNVESTPWVAGLPGAVVRGVYHVHTIRSDGTGTVDDVAAAAGRAGLDFVVLTDHGDGTRTPDAPRYVGGVLVIDAVEISTTGGHYAALGLPGPSPFRLGGAPADVVEDVGRMGGFGIVAHPDSPKKALAWKDWSPPLAAFEWLNADSEWRDETKTSLFRTLLTYPFRSPESIAALFGRPAQTLERWDRFAAEGRYLVALAGADAHARLGFRDYEDDGSPGLAVRVPSYETVFRSFATYVHLDQPFQGRPAEDAVALVAALRAGKSHTGIAGKASPVRFEYFARTPQGVRSMGATLPRGESVTLVARGLTPAGARWRLLRNGVPIAESSGLDLEHVALADLRPGERGVSFRVEVAGPEGVDGVPWVVSNPIFVAPEAGESTVAESRTSGELERRRGVDLRACASEKDALSAATIDVDQAGDDLRWRWRLAGETAPAWVALACAIDGLPVDAPAITFTASADAPMRLSVQLREAPAGAVERRWSRTVYVDSQPRAYVVPAASMNPVASERGAPSGDIRTLLFVVDWVHGRPGMQRGVRLERTAFVPEGGGQVRTVNSR